VDVFVKSTNDAFFFKRRADKKPLSLFFESTLEDQNDNCVRRELLRSFTLQKSLLERASARIINMWCKDVCFVRTPFTPFSFLLFPEEKSIKKHRTCIQKVPKNAKTKIFEKYRDAWSPKKGPNLVLWCSVFVRQKVRMLTFTTRQKGTFFSPQNTRETRTHRYTRAYIHRIIMVLPIVASAVAGAGIKTVLDKTVLNNKNNKSGDDNEKDGDAAVWNVDQSMNKNHDADALKSRYLAQHYPAVDERDAKTPDNWVKRHPNLIRLTGKHPFNVEASLPELFDYGFISPVNLHIVRNHGAVPKLEWDTHRIKINGNVKKPYDIGMDELSKLPYEQFPCLVVCAGNRRKEQNMIKSSIGFNWGPCAVGNTYWKGVPLRVLLNKAGIYKAGPGARFVCLNGPQDELPKSYDGQDGGPGSYGTSIDMETALDPTCDVIVAYEQNGERLHPDHGYPVRIIIPGYIGGRMIKFLTEITVTDRESNNFYHFNDNRVLPPTVDAEIATKDKWWFKEEYIINQLNINGAIAYPAHEEVIKPSTTKYVMKGYAYSGGGRKVIRAEVSFDQGMSWKLADINVRETPRWAAGGSGDKARHWCWCMWEYELDTSVLFDPSCKEILFRAVDQSQNFMPERPTWNVMGMLNNPWYRVRVHNEPDGGVKMEHATIAGPTPGGWMQQMAEKAGGELLWGWGGEGVPAAP